MTPMDDDEATLEDVVFEALARAGIGGTLVGDQVMAAVVKWFGGQPDDVRRKAQAWDMLNEGLKHDGPG